MAESPRKFCGNHLARYILAICASNSLGWFGVAETGVAVRAAGAGGRHLLTFQRCFGNSEAHVYSDIQCTTLFDAGRNEKDSVGTCIGSNRTCAHAGTDGDGHGMETEDGEEGL
jgi:hypothetical protein